MAHIKQNFISEYWWSSWIITFKIKKNADNFFRKQETWNEFYSLFIICLLSLASNTRMKIQDAENLIYM